MRARQFKYLQLLGIFVSLFIACDNKNSNQEVIQEIPENNISSLLRRDYTLNENSYRDNLRKALSAIENEDDDSLKTKYYAQVSLKLFGIKDSIYFQKANKLTLKWAKKIKDSATIGDAHYDAGDFYNYYDVADSAYYHYTSALKIYKNLQNDYYAGRMLYNMAKAQGTIKDYTAAETYAIEAIKLFKPLEKYDRLYSSYNYLGIISNNLKEFEKALEYHAQALDYLDKIEDKGTLEVSSMNNIGAVYRDQGNFKAALEEFENAIESDSLYFRDTELYAKVLSNIGYSQFELGNLSRGKLFLKKAIAIQDSIGDDITLSRSYYHLAEVYLKSGDTANSLRNAKLARIKAQASDNNLRVLETLGLLTKIDPKNATAYTAEYITLNDSLQIAERRARNKFERIRFETNETLAENELLARQKQLWTGIAATLLLLAISAFIIIDQRRKNEKLRFQEEQQASNQKIFNMLLNEKSNIEEGKKLAQKRISEELHDAVQGRIQGIRMLLLGLNKRNTPEAIEQRGVAISELQDVQEEVRAISHELSHSAYQKIYGFITTIQDLLNDVKESAGLQSSFLFNEEVDWDGLDGDVKINVYRIIQESIQNCVKHAHAKNVELTFSIQKNEKFKVVLKDDGKGFKVKSRKKGIGMRNINSRVEKLKGSWEINSTIGQGTTVILYIPIKNQKQFHKAAENIVAAS